MCQWSVSPILVKLSSVYLLSPGVGQVIEGWDAGLDGTNFKMNACAFLFCF